MDLLNIYWSGIQSTEASAINFIQRSQLKDVEYIWSFLGKYTTVPMVMDVIVPLVGSLHHELLFRMVLALSIVNTFSSLVKWCLPQYRPLWWVKEFPKWRNVRTLRQNQFTCEPSAGFPSSHVTAITTCVYLIAGFLLPLCHRRLTWHPKYVQLIATCVAVIASVCVSLSRLYFACQFLYQCILSVLATFYLLRILDRHLMTLFRIERGYAILYVTGLGILPVAMYVGMLQSDIDPLWPVRIAFKWCSSADQMNPEFSPIFVLVRDFGYLFGVALSASLGKRYTRQSSFLKRVAILIPLEMVNWYSRMNIPKDKGRVVFLGYEFLRNALHSYLLLTKA